MAAPTGERGSGAVVCIPTYNERENVEQVVPAVLTQLPGAHVLIIDDASPDGTGELASAMADRDERVHVLHREQKQGLGPAYLAGFAWALERDYAHVFEFDADFSHNPRYLPAMLDQLDDSDVVVGSRRVPGGGVDNWGWIRRFISWGGSLYARTILGVPIRDLTGGFNGFRRHVLERIDLDGIRSTGYAFQIELKYRALLQGFRVIESPIVFVDRVHGTSKMGGWIIFEALARVWKLRGLRD